MPLRKRWETIIPYLLSKQNEINIKLKVEDDKRYEIKGLESEQSDRECSFIVRR